MTLIAALVILAIIGFGLLLAFAWLWLELVHPEGRIRVWYRERRARRA